MNDSPRLRPQARSRLCASRVTDKSPMAAPAPSAGSAGFTVAAASPTFRARFAVGFAKGRRMSSIEGGTHRFARMAFLSSGSPEADGALVRLAACYGNVAPHEADVIVPLGGDGLMLQTLHRFMGSNKPIYGMNRGSV